MKRIWFCFAVLAPLAVLWACTGDDDVFRSTDAGAFDGSRAFDRFAPPPSDGGPSPLSCGDAGGAPPRVLLVQGNFRGTSELAVVNLLTKAVDGRLAFDGGYGVTSALATDPYLLGGETDLVTRLDAREPWRPVASWNVRGNDGRDGGEDNANPVAVVMTSCTKAYVLRYNRDRIAIIDPSQRAGGAPTGYIDLTPYKEPADPNMIEMTSAVYVPSKRKVYVLLGNTDLTQTVTVGGLTTLKCAPLKPSIIAIDVDTDKVVSLGGSARGNGIALEGYNPTQGSPLVYDGVLERLLVLQAGCTEVVDGGATTIARRRVEQVNLATGVVKTLLSLDNQGFPSSLAFVSGDHAALAFYFDGYQWDPHQPALGLAIPGGMDIIASDRRGAFVGTRATFLDGGPGPLQVAVVPASDAGLSIIIENPFSKPGGYVAGVEAWAEP